MGLDQAIVSRICLIFHGCLDIEERGICMNHMLSFLSCAFATVAGICFVGGIAVLSSAKGN